MFLLIIMEAKEKGIDNQFTQRVGNQAIFMVTRVHHLMTRRANQELMRLNFPLQIDQLPILFVVLLAGADLLAQQEIADLLKRDKSGIRRSVRTLERDGYLRIVADAHDRRKNLIQLTPPGKMAIEKVLMITAAVDAEIMSDMTHHERETFTSVATKIINQLND